MLRLVLNMYRHFLVPVFLHSLMVEEWKMNANMAIVFLFLLGSRRYFRIYHILGYDGRGLQGSWSDGYFMKSIIK